MSLGPEIKAFVNIGSLLVDFDFSLAQENLSVVRRGIQEGAGFPLVPIIWTSHLFRDIS